MLKNRNIESSKKKKRMAMTYLVVVFPFNLVYDTSLTFSICAIFFQSYLILFQEIK